MLLGNVPQVYHSTISSPLTIDLNPYAARQKYVELADRLLRAIPGDHQNQMSKWHTWDLSQSPPLPGYPNPAYDRAHPVEQGLPLKEGKKKETEGRNGARTELVNPGKAEKFRDGPILIDGAMKGTEGNHHGPTIPAITGKGESLINNANLNEGPIKQVEAENLGPSSYITTGGVEHLNNPELNKAAMKQIENTNVGHIYPAITGGAGSSVTIGDGQNVPIGAILDVPLNHAIAQSSIDLGNLASVPGIASPQITAGGIGKHVAMMGG